MGFCHCWWRLASEFRKDIFPEQIGRYWVWREDDAEARGLFRAEIRHWEAELLDAPSPTAAIPASRDRQSREQPAESDASGKEKQSQVGSSLVGIADQPRGTPKKPEAEKTREHWAGTGSPRVLNAKVCDELAQHSYPDQYAKTTLRSPARKKLRDALRNR